MLRTGLWSWVGARRAASFTGKKAEQAEEKRRSPERVPRRGGEAALGATRESLRGAGSCAKAHRREAPGRFTRGHRGATDTDEGESVEDKNARGPVWFRVGVVRRPPSLVRLRNCKNWEGTRELFLVGG